MSTFSDLSITHMRDICPLFNAAISLQANSKWADLKDPRILFCLQHIEESHQLKIMRFRNPTDALSSFFNITVIQLQYGLQAIRSGQVGSENTSCLLCLGRCVKDAQGRPEWQNRCINRNQTCHEKCVCVVDTNGSHHGGQVGIAVGQHRVGLDIVHIHPPQHDTDDKVEQFQRLMHSTMSSDEANQQNRLPSISLKMARFSGNWAFKEAFVKAIGQGLVFHPQNVSRHIHDEELQSTAKIIPSSSIELRTASNECIADNFLPLTDWSHYSTEVQLNFSVTMLQAPVPSNVNCVAFESQQNIISDLRSTGTSITPLITELSPDMILNLVFQTVK